MSPENQASPRWRHLLRYAWGLAILFGSTLPSAKLAGAEPPPEPIGPVFSEDPALKGLVAEAMSVRPELVQARAQIRAEEERVPQGRALPDPTLSLGIQNDGFSGIQIGKMPTSFVAISASQTFPWLGKRGLRSEVASIAAREAESDLQRVSLSITADVERAYLDLLLVRDQLGLLARLQSLWSQSETLARVRYEAGEGPQSDLLRAQLERQRLQQQRWVLESEARQRIAVLNRLRGHSLTEPVATQRTLSDIPDPAEPDPAQAVADAEAQSPELKRALLAGKQAGRRVELAKKERWPDLTVMAGVMPRGSNYETMWQAGVSLNLPVWSRQKQSRVIAENQARGEAANNAAEAIRQILHQRIHERLAILHALVEANRLYRAGLLVQSEATVASTIAQYQVGRVTFASVLEALAGYVSDQNGFLSSVAAAQRIDIAQREVSLDAPAGASSGGMGSASMPGAGVVSGGTPAGRVTGQATGQAVEAGGTGGGSMSRM